MNSHHLMAVVTAFLFTIILVPQVSSDNEINEQYLLYSRSESRSRRDAANEDDWIQIKSNDLSEKKSKDLRNKQHDFKLGKYTRGVVFFYSEYVTIDRVPSKVVSENVSFPLYPNDEGYIRDDDDDDCVISFITVHPVGPISTVGYPSVLEGGVGYDNVTINFTSQPDRECTFYVAIWGEKRQ